MVSIPVSPGEILDKISGHEEYHGQAERQKQEVPKAEVITHAARPEGVVLWTKLLVGRWIEKDSVHFDSSVPDKDVPG